MRTTRHARIRCGNQKKLRQSQAILIVVLLSASAHCGLASAYPDKQPSAQGNPEGEWQIIERIGNGFVADEKKPANLSPPKKNLSKTEQLENFEILWEAIDRHYSFFDLKSIDWQKLGKRYRFRVKNTTNDDEYYRVLLDLMRELKDSHCFFWNYKSEPLGTFSPNVCVSHIHSKAVVTYVTPGSDADAKGLHPGAVITRVDGLSVAEKIEKMREALPAYSSDRMFQAAAHRLLLRGEKDSKVKVTFLPPDGKSPVETELRRSATMPSGQSWQYREMSFPVEKGQFLWVGKHPSGYGYIRIVTFEGREEIAEEFDLALEKLKHAPGLIIDIRDNGGGSGASQLRIIGRLITAPARVAINFRKNGPGHQDFRHNDQRVSPTGDWQYTKPVALLTNVYTGSAADLFACMMRGTGRVVTVGSTTHGNLPGHSVLAVLPCGLVARISDSYVADLNGRIIEANGNEPQIHAELTVKDVIDRTDSVMERAVKVLQGRSPVASRTVPSKAPAAKTGVQNGRNASRDQTMSLEFTLADAYGREIHADDYRGVPVLISTGACWCGGCQGDAEQLQLLEQKYRSRGLQFIRSVSYDNSLPAWEFQKHYRLPYVQVLDPLRTFERRYNRNGWPFIMLADQEGNVVFRKNQLDWQELTKLIESLLPDHSPVETVQREGISYMPATVKRSGETTMLRQIDRFPSLACVKDGRVYVAYTTNRGGTQDVYLRVFDGKKWLPDRPIAATDADEFDGAMVIDQDDRPWVAWTSNSVGRQYNIFATCATEFSGESEPAQITHCKSTDDAMHPRMAVDAKGRVWVTYYQWERIHGTSRDKEVYTQCLEKDHWSEAIHVSPEDVSEFEDHTDPVIAAIGDGVVIGWSWDFHRQLSCPRYSEVPDNPSIFLRKVEPGPKFGPVRAVSGANIDTRPALAVGPDGRVFCAWESVGWDRNVGSDQKMISATVEHLEQKEQPGIGTNATGPKQDVCTPCLAVSPKGDVAIVWSELGPNGQWTLMLAQWNSKKNIHTGPKTLVSKGNPRFPSAAFAKNGKLWIAYCVNKGDRREVAVLSRSVDAR